jgi:hypothetical protein
MNKPTLSISELNEIAAEFDLVFERRPPVARSVWANRVFSDIRGVLADRLEDAGSQWCQFIRHDMRFTRSIWLKGFTLID